MRGRASEVAASLREYAFWLERDMADTHRITAYRRAAEVAAGLDEVVAARTRSVADWKVLPTFGSSTGELRGDGGGRNRSTQMAEARRSGAQPLDPDGAELGDRLRGDLDPQHVVTRCRTEPFAPPPS